MTADKRIKTATLTLRLSAEDKADLQRLAADDNRSITSYLENMIRQRVAETRIKEKK